MPVMMAGDKLRRLQLTATQGDSGASDYTSMLSEDSKESWNNACKTSV